MFKKTVEMCFEYMNTIPKPPTKHEDMFKQACSNDDITIKTWRKIWLDQMANNQKTYGPFKDHNAIINYKKFQGQAVILVGSGPSLKENIKDLKEAGDKGIPIISCLHNFHYLIDNGVKVHAFVTLDAGKVTIEEISEGGQKSHEEYISATKDNLLYCFTGSHPDLLASWQGEKLFFTCPIPDQEMMDEMKRIENFNTWVSTGGNVLGACLYIAKAILGAYTIVYTGADFCFSYDRKFHAWDSKYDADIGQAMRAIDVYGNCRLTWQSYYNFKVWFDFICEKVPGIWVNCTEGGLLGAYPEGNIQSIKQMSLKDWIKSYTIYENIEDQFKNPDVFSNKILF